jgi:hypothetical protein
MFTLPSFNTSAAIWRTPNAPPALPSFTYPAQLYFTSRGQFGLTPTDNTVYAPPVYLRVPKGSDVEVGDVVECPPFSGWFYVVRFIERTHLNFPNEYLSAVLEQQSTGLFPSGAWTGPTINSNGGTPTANIATALAYGWSANESAVIAVTVYQGLGSPPTVSGTSFGPITMILFAGTGIFAGVTVNIYYAVVPGPIASTIVTVQLPGHATAAMQLGIDIYTALAPVTQGGSGSTVSATSQPLQTIATSPDVDCGLFAIFAMVNPTVADVLNAPMIHLTSSTDDAFAGQLVRLTMVDGLVYPSGTYLADLGVDGCAGFCSGGSEVH